MNWMELCHMRAQRPRDAGNFDRQHLFNRPSHRLEKTPSSSTIALIIEITEHVLRPIVGIALLFASVTAAPQPQGPQGVWLTEDRDGGVEIYDSARISAAASSGSYLRCAPTANPDVDDTIPIRRCATIRSAACRSSATLSPSGPAKWSGGWVYDPDHGQTYGAEADARKS